MTPKNGKANEITYLRLKGWEPTRKNDAGDTFWRDPLDRREEREDRALVIQRQRDTDPDLFPDRPGFDPEG